MSSIIIHLKTPKVRIDLEQIEGPDAQVLLTIEDEDSSVLIGIRPRDLVRLGHALGMASEKIQSLVQKRFEQALVDLEGLVVEGEGEKNRSETEQNDPRG